MIDKSLHSHRIDSPNIYDNGCVICDAQDSVLSYAYDTAVYPPWIDSGELKEQEAVKDIRVILNFYNVPSSTEMREAFSEVW